MAVPRSHRTSEFVSDLPNRSVRLLHSRRFDRLRAEAGNRSAQLTPLNSTPWNGRRRRRAPTVRCGQRRIPALLRRHQHLGVGTRVSRTRRS